MFKNENRLVLGEGYSPYNGREKFDEGENKLIYNLAYNVEDAAKKTSNFSESEINSKSETKIISIDTKDGHKHVVSALVAALRLDDSKHGLNGQVDAEVVKRADTNTMIAAMLRDKFPIPMHDSDDH